MHFYSWVMDVDDVVVGTIGAYDYAHDQIEAGFSVDHDWQGRGFAAEALRKVLVFLWQADFCSQSLGAAPVSRVCFCWRIEGEGA